MERNGMSMMSFLKNSILCIFTRTGFFALTIINSRVHYSNTTVITSLLDEMDSRQYRFMKRMIKIFDFQRMKKPK
jgi:hypothetical protein